MSGVTPFCHPEYPLTQGQARQMMHALTIGSGSLGRMYDYIVEKRIDNEERAASKIDRCAKQIMEASWLFQEAWHKTLSLITNPHMQPALNEQNSGSTTLVSSMSNLAIDVSIDRKKGPPVMDHVEFFLVEEYPEKPTKYRNIHDTLMNPQNIVDCMFAPKSVA